MKKVALFALALCFVISASAVGQDARITPGINTGQSGKMGPKMGEGRYGEKPSCESSCASGECPVVAKAMESLPKMVFKIGDQETCCHMTATRMAHESHSEIVYWVGKRKFKDSHDAFEALVKQTETFVRKSLSPSVCEETGATFIAGQSCDADSCDQIAAKVTSTVDGLKLRYAVGEKEFERYNDARRFARKSHRKGSYLVDGEKFENEYEARLALAHKKFRTAVTTIQQTKSGNEAAADTESVEQKPAEKKSNHQPKIKIG